ncbi:transfer protein Tra [Intrasporangium chromatireducens Q5-1]|uniref:Transfer protein Tra n=1 Tax=Intrasporangium chromatireducens Q5-1 TaxID=584657 RepID=W9GKA2_9MICO|nr:MobF family relaxase [Intrasporangium chromatireducens]EWT05263.1 transfer protein Tra [Intrasporangium chromatireducens Q5-1]
MSIHKLTTGSGYDYLTRQVAALDTTEKGHTGLASYYTTKGESPGVWVGCGLAGIEGLSAGDVVTAGQMQALFGSGHHPMAHERRARLAADASDAQVQAVTRLGLPYRVYEHDVTAFRVEVARRVAAVNADAGLPRDWPVPLNERARIRTEVATGFFRAEHGRDPVDAREVAATIAKHSRPQTTAVAGYDLTFSPVKSVSALWAIASPAVASRIERAHRAAVQDALTFIEGHALYTRTGTNGIRQVDVQGLVAAAFTHRDSRAGDPDLHTHVAVANKVQTLDGRWLSIDGRVLFKATVAASETYNTALEAHLHTELGLRFQARDTADVRKRPVREVLGVDPRLNARWSTRRASIEARRGELAEQFQATHGRPPTPIESIQLAQQATLETREAKHEPRSLAEQRDTWRAQAVEVLGSAEAVHAMVTGTLARQVARPVEIDGAWVAAMAERVVAAVETRRATWQTWHVRAEALRQVRAADLPDSADPERAVDHIVNAVLTTRSVPLVRGSDDLVEPPQLRRRDGASVYSLAGATQYTSARVLAAERRLVTWAGIKDGYAAGPVNVELALLEAAANGTTLNPGQAALVREMATCSARLALAIAPAGAGKTTAMRALAAAWTDAGGDVIGLAPSAAAAAALREHTGAHTDTLAKLVWSLQQHDLPAWAEAIGPRTLVVIDEAGMADTISLDAAVAFVTGHGGSVRLVGDDRQLAAIGAGGVLRDIEASHGATRLTELMRFTDPAEGAASLALRDGRVEALGFYLDHGRVHVGDLATMTDAVFTAWQTDRQHGVDAIMLAPTRELVAELNQRARAHRLTDNPSHSLTTREPASEPGGISAVRLADGNDASVGDLIITRANERRLRISPSDWVKNGDRWTVLTVRDDGAVTAQHARNGRIVTLPAEYVTTSVELGYATTVHGAQGVSVEVMHGLATGQESRQQLYTMLTRGRAGNHVYLQVVGDGDPHTVITPETVFPATPTDLLEAILARDDAPTSATSLLRDLAAPATRLGHATSRYVDALYAAADDTLGPDVSAALEDGANQLAPGLTGEAAWPALRAHLLLLAAAGTDPMAALRDAAERRQLDTATDLAAVLDWRLDDTGLRNAGRGPLPWTPAVPAMLASHPAWGEYLDRRADLVAGLAEQVRSAVAPDTVPAWAAHAGHRVEPALVAEVAVWRAAMQVPDTDQRPTGPRQLAKAAAVWQRSLDARLTAGHGDALDEWAPLLTQLEPRLDWDPFAPTLAARLAALSRAALDVPALLREATAPGPLPDDHAAAALWWRISHHVEPAVAASLDTSDALTAPWIDQLVEQVGPDRADQIRASQFWPALVTVIDRALQRGYRLTDLLDTAGRDLAGSDLDECHAMVWRLSVLTDPPQPDTDFAEPDPAPPDLLADVVPPADAPTTAEWQDFLHGHPDPEPDLPAVTDEETTTSTIEAQLRLDALVRDTMGPLDPTDTEIERILDRAHDWDDCPIPRDRMVQVNELATTFYESQYQYSWARDYLAARLGQDLTGHPDYRPGYAPPGWTALVDHLRALGVTDEEMITTGVAGVARTGRLIDRFRDRAVLPIIHDGDVLGFVGRRHPDRTDAAHAEPKYLNTATTALFHKGAQLYGALPHLRDAGADPVLVEGPIDALAVTLATAGSHVGLAPLGTALTEEQARELLTYQAAPVIATDADQPGRRAAERAFWMLTQHGLAPTVARLHDGLDPASMLAEQGPEALVAALQGAQSLGASLVQERLNGVWRPGRLGSVLAVIAAQPADTWESDLQRIANRTGTDIETLRGGLAAATGAWNEDPRRVAEQHFERLRTVSTRAGQPRAVPAQRHTREGVSVEAPRLAARARAEERHAAARPGSGSDPTHRGR